MSTEAHGTAEGGVAGFLQNPVVGMAPWIVFSLLVGPGRFEIAVGIALATAAALVVVGRIVNRGSSWKILEISDVVFFAVMAVIGAVASDGTLRWLETYAGEVSNIALTVIALLLASVQMDPYLLEIGSPGKVKVEVNQIVDTGSGRPSTVADVARSAKGARFVYLGESHNSPAHHQMQADVIEALAAAGHDVVVGFEQFTRPVQANLNPWTLGWWDEATFIERADWLILLFSWIRKGSVSQDLGKDPHRRGPGRTPLVEPRSSKTFVGEQFPREENVACGAVVEMAQCARRQRSTRQLDGQRAQLRLRQRRNQDVPTPSLQKRTVVRPIDSIVADGAEQAD